MEDLRLAEVLKAYPPQDTARIQAELAAALKSQTKKIIVLDDDPTGVQTVHDVSVYTRWDEESIEQGFRDEGLFFILTNSRSMPPAAAAKTNREIAHQVAVVSKKLSRDFILVSRSDSTLRGHYPLETQTLKETLEKETAIRFDGEIICPFFVEGGRYTVENIHYVKYGETLVPAAETEFAKDKSFGYKNSDLTLWVEEKTGGKFSHRDVLAISVDMLRRGGPDVVCSELAKGKNFCKVILNALSYDDIRIFCTGFIKAVNMGKRYLFRSAAAIPKILGGIPDLPLLRKEQLVVNTNNGGLIVIGSHVQKTTEQLAKLRELTGVEYIEFNQHLVLNPQEFAREIARVKELSGRLLAAGRDTVIYTRRGRLDLNTGNPEEELRLSKSISDAITSFVTDLAVQPAYIIAKGGITSSDIGTMALGVRRALVLGQVLPGIPVWQTGPESKFPGMPYIIFPGNVGGPDALKLIVQNLKN
jgi:uncharacterized protein YgbK (DUF1537 family)